MLWSVSVSGAQPLKCGLLQYFLNILRENDGHKILNTYLSMLMEREQQERVAATILSEIRSSRISHSHFQSFILTGCFLDSSHRHVVGESGAAFFICHPFILQLWIFYVEVLWSVHSGNEAWCCRVGIILLPHSFFDESGYNLFESGSKLTDFVS